MADVRAYQQELDRAAASRQDPLTARGLTLMWYPNKAQWRVIWVMAAGFTVVTLPSIDTGGGPLLFALFIDGALLVWKLQKPTASK